MRPSLVMLRSFYSFFNLGQLFRGMPHTVWITHYIPALTP